MRFLMPPTLMFRMYVSIALMSATVAYADSVGMVSDNSAKTITVLGAEDGLIKTSIAAPSGQTTADCSVTSDERMGFSTSASNEITVVELSRSDSERPGASKQVPISNLGLDMSLSPDDTFLVLAGGGEIQAPLAVIDTRIQEEVATSVPFADHTSVEFCDNGTLLVTTTYGKYFDSVLDNALYDAAVGHRGKISLRGHRLSTGDQPVNSACAPGSYAGVLLDRKGGLQTFTLPGLRPASRIELATGPGHAATFNHDGSMLYVRTAKAIEAFHFNPLTGELALAWTRNAPKSLAFYGVDPIALNPSGDKLYVDGIRGMTILDPVTGETEGSISLGHTTGVCFARSQEVPDLDRVSRLWSERGLAGS